MTTRTPPRPTAYRSALDRGGDGFGRLLHAEWTKLRTVRRWTIVMLSAVVVTVLVSMISAGGSSVSGGGGGAPPKGPGGESVSDSFRFVGQPLTGDGTVTARVTGLERDLDEGGEEADGTDAAGKPFLPSPWAKAGIIVKASTTPGSTYAAMMLTQSHGVRFQADFTVDRAGSSASPSAPRWLRLTRAGNLVTGYESADGVTWDKVGSVTLKGLSDTAEVGLFVTSPAVFAVEREFGSTSVDGAPSASTATFDGLSVQGRTAGALRAVDVGADDRGPGGPGPGGPGPGGPGPQAMGRSASSEADGVHTLTASGDIAPLELDTDLAQRSLAGAMIGLIPLAALGVLFITAEYRKGMILTTFTASPRRGRVMAAKALVLGGATFAVGLVASVSAFLISQPLLRSTGHEGAAFPEPSLSDGTVLGAVVGTAGVLALVAVFALALGALLRNTAAAVSVIVVLLVLPQILLSGLPLGAAKFIMQTTPVAGFAVQRTTENFSQVDSVCVPEDGCYPQAPWAGFGVLFLYAAVALALAVWRIRRRSA